MQLLIHIAKIIVYIFSIICVIEFICRWIKFRHLPVPNVLRKVWRQKTVNYKDYCLHLSKKHQEISLFLKLKIVCLVICGVKLQIRIATESVSYSIISTLRDLPLTTFIICSLNDDYSGLGNAPEDVIKKTWAKLYSDFHELRQDSHVNPFLKISGEMAALELRQKMITIACNSMLRNHTDKRRKDFAELGYPFEFSESSIEQDIQRVINREKPNVVRLKQLKEEYARLQKNNTGHKKIKEESFYETVAAMNEAWKTSYSIQNMSTLEYCIYSKRLDKYIDNSKNK